MSVLVVGTTALDSIKTPKRENPRLLGGSASHAAVAASFFAPTKLVGVVGDDFPAKYIKLYEKHGIDLKGLERVKGGVTFHWSGEYEVNMNNRRTIETVLGVIEHWQPALPGDYETTPYVLLANISPQVQIRIADQVSKPKFVVADTMDLWLNIALPDVMQLLKKIDCLVLNDGEARQLTKEDNTVAALPKLHKMGPKYVIIKKGEHGALLSSPKGLFVAPAYPLKKVIDPTGAGDSFVGGMLGYLASQGGSVDAHIRQAIIHGTVVASFCCEGFGLNVTTATTKAEVNARVRELEKLARF
ncbi:MAG TPA: PfkB family carbohydrate kinase [Candidatus Limnocylindria bacterium]|jgi:sugar/nucleoside kinase (ribokinase family)|nr:PfkB family carbohydrate kinase [Candidatus Limnocylindria bacterium]